MSDRGSVEGITKGSRSSLWCSNPGRELRIRVPRKIKSLELCKCLSLAWIDLAAVSVWLCARVAAHPTNLIARNGFKEMARDLRAACQTGWSGEMRRLLCHAAMIQVAGDPFGPLGGLASATETVLGLFPTNVNEINLIDSHSPV